MPLMKLKRSVGMAKAMMDKAKQMQTKMYIANHLLKSITSIMSLQSQMDHFVRLPSPNQLVK
ncbi:hypothetical protein E2320_019115 [Naja naja]|nr:hypothetical protein E2320_019115 [Naja naja]